MKSLPLLCLLLAHVAVLAQDNNETTVKSIYGLQTGLVGVWIYAEKEISPEVALRFETGLDAEVFGGSNLTNTGFYLVPIFTVEPRWYYNIDERAEEEKVTRFNSGNFLTVKLRYHPDWFIISSYDLDVIQDVAIIPKWGIKRNLIGSINYEAGIGLGYRHFFLKDGSSEGEAAIDLHLRIGFAF